MKAVLRRAGLSSKKANLVAGLVRGKKVTEALAILKFTPKKAAKILYKVVESAAANAKNNFKQPFNDLVITRLLVTKGPTYKRSLPISRGRTHPILKRTCHITVEVGVLEGPAKVAHEKMMETKDKEAAKKVAKTAAKKAAAPQKTTDKKPEVKKAAPKKADKAPAKKKTSK